MAGSIVASSVTPVIAANESLNTLAAKITLMFQSATFQNFSDDESATSIAILRSQSSAPSSVVDDFWHDTTSRTLRVYNGFSPSQRWNPIGIGMNLQNQTGGARVAGEVVGVSAGAGDLQYNQDSSNLIAGVVGESTSDMALGLLRMSAKATVNVTGAVSRGDFLTKNSAGGNNNAISAGTTLDGAFGIALTANAGPGAGTVSAYLFPYNSTT